jgi:GMP synthase-like glutamine amidotransferase
MIKKILIVDNNLNHPCGRCSKFHRHFNAKAAVMHRVDKPFPTDLSSYSHIILTGSGGDVDDLSDIYKRLKPLILRAEREGIPMFGICYGFEAIIAALSNTSNIEHYKRPEIGFTRVKIVSPSRIFEGIPKNLYVFENHAGTVKILPRILRKIAISGRGTVQAFEHKTKPIFGTQFHPEYTVTQAYRRIGIRMKHHLPLRWFTNTEKPKNFDSATAEKIITNFYHSTSKFKSAKK